MPHTAKKHFSEDIQRATNIVALAEGLPSGQARSKLLRDDLLRSAWMFAIGAMDAYFCDAYIEVLVKSIRAKSEQDSVELRKFVAQIEVPVGAVLADYNERSDWRWRMAVREMMKRDNVLSLGKVKTLFNPFFRDDKKLFSGVLDAWITSRNANSRLFGMTKRNYLALAIPKDKDKARKKAGRILESRFNEIIQRRHDCIHNCDRPKTKPQSIQGCGTVANVIRDVRFLVEKCDDHIDAEFREFLLDIGCAPQTMNRLGM